MTASESTTSNEGGSEEPGPSLMRGAGALLVSRLVVAALGWTGTVLIARELGQEGFGAFTLVFSLLGMLSIITDLGIGRIALAGLVDPSEDSARFGGTYVVLRSILGLIGYAVVVGFVAVAGYDHIVLQATMVAGLVPVLATPAHAFEIAFQAHHRLDQMAAVRVVAQVGQLGLTIALVISGRSLVWLTVPAVLNAFLLLAIIAPLAHRLESFTYTVDRHIWGRLLREAVPLSVGTAMATLYYRVDSVMLSKLDDLNAVGVYGVAYKFIDVAHFVPSALSVAILAVLVRSWPSDVERFRATLVKAATLLAIIGGLLVVEFALFAEPIIALSYGAAYDVGGRAARILMLGESASYFTSLCFAALVASGHNRRYPWITLAGLLVNVAVNLILIPAWSFEGAAVATLLTEVIVAGLMISEVSRIPGLAPLDIGSLWRVFVPLGAGAGAGLLSAQFVHWIPAATATAIIYLLVANRIRIAETQGVVALVRSL